jgi:hypothetical protein
MTGKYQRILLRAPAKGDFTIVLNLDRIDAPVNEVQDGSGMGRILIFFLWSSVEFVRYFVGSDITRLIRYREVAVECRYCR